MQHDSLDGRFVVERRAGEGGMGAVYRAIDLATQRPVALKVLLTAHREQQTSRFEREAQLLAELSHPGIVRYVAHGLTARGGLYLAMEWLEGEDLGSRLRARGLTTEETVRLADRVADALGYAHSRGVVHRDIKPSNLFLVGGDLDGVRIIDFGVASAASGMSLTRTGTGIGTPGYMSPEQVRGARDVTPAADVFALGSVLYECLAARPAFVGDNVLALLAQLLHEDVPRLSTLVPGLAPPLEDLVHRMLDKAPAMRPANGHAVLAALRAIAAGSPELGPRERVTLRRPRPRPKWIAEVTCPSCYWTGPQEMPAGAHGRIPVTCAKCNHAFELDATIGCEIDRDLDLASLDEPALAAADRAAPTISSAGASVGAIASPSTGPVGGSQADAAVPRSPAGAGGARSQAATADPHAELDLAPSSNGPALELDLQDDRPANRAVEPDTVSPDLPAAAHVAARAAVPIARNEPARPRSPARARAKLQAANLGRRAAAALVDALIVYGVQGALWRWWLTNARGRLVAAGAGPDELQRLGWIAFGLALALAMVSATYFVVPTAVWGQTLGKKLFGLRVVGDDGEIPSIGRAALREVAGRWLSMLCCGLGFAMAWLDVERRSLADRVATTRVVDAD
ncbi:MAG: protein kinase [Deltaproteobacteria bacterium]|nr:protein kinase [Deltaproteobacteria bacterium]